jgi:hypothetical protein
MLLLKKLTPAMHAFLLKEQAKIQLAEGQKISLERIVYRIIREKISTGVETVESNRKRKK